MSTASGPGSFAAAQHSSQIVKPRIPATAGQWPSRSGYSSGSGIDPRATRAATQPVARPIARHGFTSRNTLPNSSDANGTPIQNPTYTAVGARFSLWLSAPASPAYTVTANTKTPTAPSSTSTASGMRNRGRAGGRSRRGRDHPAASARKEMTSTAAAATANIATGIGKSARPTIPCAKRITAKQSKNDEGPANRGAFDNQSAGVRLTWSRRTTRGSPP